MLPRLHYCVALRCSYVLRFLVGSLGDLIGWKWLYAANGDMVSESMAAALESPTDREPSLRERKRDRFGFIREGEENDTY